MYGVHIEERKSPLIQRNMGMPHMTSFLWCMGLKTGAYCIGFVHVIAALLLLATSSVMAANFANHMDHMEDKADPVYTTWYKICIAGVVVSLVHVILALVLLISVRMCKRKGVLVWMFGMMIFYSAAILFIVVSSAIFGVSGSGSDIFVSFLEALLFFGFITYCILCVYSFYLLLKSSEHMRVPNYS